MLSVLAGPDFPVLVSQAVIIPYQKTFEGELIRAVTLPLLAIIQKILEDPSRLYGIDPRKLEEIIAATYDESGLFDEVTLTPRSGDRGQRPDRREEGVRLGADCRVRKEVHAGPRRHRRRSRCPDRSDEQATPDEQGNHFDDVGVCAEDTWMTPTSPAWFPTASNW